MSSLPVFKVTGAGNHFLLVDLRTSDSRTALRKIAKGRSRARLAREWCDPFQGVGADGLFFLEPCKIADTEWDFYNADGSRAEMCGNAARCVGLYLDSTARKSRREGSEYTLKTRSGIVSLRIVGNGIIEAQMPPVKSVRWDEKFNVKDRTLNKLEYTFVDSGVPHAVVEVPSLQSELVAQDVVDHLRTDKSFRPRGTNVTFFRRKNKSKGKGQLKPVSTAIDALTFERGVAGFTQACGTGAVAAAMVARGGSFGTVSVKVPGGLLKVKIEETPSLIGPAKIVAKVEML